MEKKTGRPRSESPLDQMLQLRLTVFEKQGFNDAAKLAGIPLSAWARERLRQAAIRELEQAAIPIPFLD